jgi:hypothetical protein
VIVICFVVSICGLKSLAYNKRFIFAFLICIYLVVGTGLELFCFLIQFLLMGVSFVASIKKQAQFVLAFKMFLFSIAFSSFLMRAKISLTVSINTPYY